MSSLKPITKLYSSHSAPSSKSPPSHPINQPQLGKYFLLLCQFHISTILSLKQASSWVRAPAISEHTGRQTSLGERGKADIAGRASDTGRRPASQAWVSHSGYHRGSHIPAKPQTQADKLQEKLLENVFPEHSTKQEKGAERRLKGGEIFRTKSTSEKT